ncbi:UbiX family flavin prenyltransferase [Candidatus Formimonas warabiya]|nr:UbiX family flavin prenyltransferase [Candidatus Formimonas warabiya]
MRIVLAITGASGAVYGTRMLEALHESGVEVHLIISRWGEETVRIETGKSVAELEQLAFKRYEMTAMDAPISSGSFQTDGTMIAPCSMKTLSAIAHGYLDSLIVRAADVALKERRKLILMPRESPLHVIHLENMIKVAQAGAIVMPPMPAFYNNPQSLSDIIDHQVGRALDIFGIRNCLLKRWGEKEELHP